MTDAPRQLWEPNDDGFRDLAFDLVHVSRAADGALTVDARCRFEGEVGGLRVLLPDAWKPSHLAESISIYSGLVKLCSLGEESDRLLRMIARVWEVESPARLMAASTTFAAIALEGKPSLCDREATKMKLFYEGRGDDGYAEFYLNVDPVGRVVELAEKDESYRPDVLAAFAADDAEPAAERRSVSHHHERVRPHPA